jgi:hypothetical protein
MLVSRLKRVVRGSVFGVVWTVSMALATLAPVQAQTSSYVATELKLPTGTTGCMAPLVNARGDVLAPCGYRKTVKRAPAPIGDNPLAILSNWFRSKTVTTTFYHLTLWPAGKPTAPQVLPDVIVPTVSNHWVLVSGFNKDGEVLVRHFGDAGLGASLWRQGRWQPVTFKAGAPWPDDVALNDLGVVTAPVWTTEGARLVSVDRLGQETLGPVFKRVDGYSEILFEGAVNALNQWVVMGLTPSSGCCPSGCVAGVVCFPSPAVTSWWTGAELKGVPPVAPKNPFNARFLNDQGQMAGHAYQRDASGWPVMYFFDGQQHTLIGNGVGEVMGLNRAGVVVGVQVVASQPQPFLWRQGVLTPLKNLLPLATGQVLAAASSINDLGQIAATASDPARSAGVVYLFTPR